LHCYGIEFNDDDDDDNDDDDYDDVNGDNILIDGGGDDDDDNGGGDSSFVKLRGALIIERICSNDRQLRFMNLRDTSNRIHSSHPAPSSQGYTYVGTQVQLLSNLRSSLALLIPLTLLV
jgi:hypothetical protein